MDKIDIDGTGLNNVDWFIDGERANATVLNRPIKDIATKVNEAIDELDLKLNTSLKGAANGLAELNSAGQVPASQLPSYVDDVLEYSNVSEFPETGETGKIYLDLDNNDIYRWTGTAYIEIVSSPYAMDQNVRTSDTVSFAQINIDNMRIDGNTISSTNVNGNIIIEPNGTGTINLNSPSEITYSGGNILTLSSTDDTSFASLRISNDSNIGMTVGTYGSAYTGSPSLSVGSNGSIFLFDSNVGMDVADGSEIIFGVNNSEKAKISSTGLDVTGQVSATGLDVTGDISATTGVTVASDQDVLSNYKQDTYTAVLTPSTSGSITLKSGTDTLRYTRIGKECFVSGALQVESVSSPIGSININIPFTAANLNELSDYGAGSVIISSSVSKNANDFGVLTFGGADFCRIYRTDANAHQEDSAQEIQADTIIYISISFPVA